MQRADRLFQIVQLIRGRRLTTAAFLVERLEVSKRSVYRDIADLQHQGVSIEGKAGVSYRLGARFDLPPLMFTKEEATALVVSARLAQTWVDPALALAVGMATAKVLSVLPPAARTAAEAFAMHAPAWAPDDQAGARLQTLCEAVQSRYTLRMTYRDLFEPSTQRTVRPLGAASTGAASGRWLPGATCAMRFAASGSIGSKPSRRRVSGFGMSRSRHWRKCCAARRRIVCRRRHRVDNSLICCPGAVVFDLRRLVDISQQLPDQSPDGPTG